MRIIIYAIFVLFLLNLSTLVAHSDSQQEAQQRSAQIEITETTFDFGAHLYNKPIAHSFKVTNTGSIPLTLKLGKASCGCTMHEVENNTVPPGSSTNIEIGYDPKAKEKSPGLHNFTTELMTNDPNNPKMILTVKGLLVDQVYTRTSRINFGTITKAQLPSQSLRISCYGDTSIPKVTSITAESPRIHIGVPKLEKTNNRRSYIYEISLDPKGLTSDIQSFITVKTDSGRVPTLEISVQAQRISPIISSPSRVLFSIVHPGIDKTINISLRSTEKEILVSQAECADNSIKVSLSKDSQPGTWILNATLRSNADVLKPTPLKTSITLLDNTGKILSEIPVHAIIMPSKK